MAGANRAGIGGWLLLLCLLLLVWQPVQMALSASGMVDAVAIRGPAAALLLAARVLAAGLGIAAGLALVGRRPAAVTLAATALIGSAAVDVVVYATPFLPNNRMPGDAPFYVAGSLAYSAAWLAYLLFSSRVKNTYR